MGAKSDPLITVRCPTCSAPRQMSGSWHRRLLADGRTLECDTCKRIGQADCQEKDLWFWLEHYGVRRNGLSAREYVVTHGVPEALQQHLHELQGVDPRVL